MKVNQLKISVFLSYFNIILNCAVNIVFSPFMIRQLGQAQYGLYQLIGSFVGYLTILNFGLGNAIIKYVAKYRHLKEEKEQSNFLSIMLILHILFSLIVSIIGVVLYFNLDKFFGNSLQSSELDQARVMFIILIINMMVAIPGGIFSSIISGYEKYAIPRILTILRTLSRIGVLIVVLIAAPSAINVVIVDTILNILVVLANMVICLKKLKVKIHLYSFDKSLVKEVFGYSFYIFLNMIIDQINWKVDQVVIGMRLSTVAVTIYSVGHTFSSIFQQFSTAISGIFLPKATKMELEGQDGNKFTNFMIRVGRVQGIILIYILVAFGLFGENFIKLLYGDGYRESWISALVVMAGLLIPLMQNVGLSILQAKNKHKFYTITFLIATILNVIVSYIIVPYYGVVGVAIITALTLTVGHTIPLNIYYHKKLKINMKRFYKELLSKTLVIIVIVTLITLFIMKFISFNSWGTFIILAVIYTVLYFGLMYLFGLNKEEKDYCNKFLRKIRGIGK